MLTGRTEVVKTNIAGYLDYLEGYHQAGIRKEGKTLQKILIICKVLEEGPYQSRLANTAQILLLPRLFNS